MLNKRISQDEDDAYAPGGAPSLTPQTLFEVLISPDGSAVLDGELFPVPEGEMVHVALLDTMHRHAQARGGPVEVVILDQQEEHVLCIEVDIDGSSRILHHEPYDTEDEPQPLPAAGPPQRDVPPSPQETWPTAPAPERTPSAVVDMPVLVPGELGELVALISHAVDTGALERASALAFRIRQHTTRAFGDEHPYTLEAHALEAFVAHRSGNHHLALDTCLELARLRRLQGDPRAQDELRRAIAAWRLIDDVPAAVDYGRALLAVWSEVAETGGPELADSELADRVSRRMHALTTATGARETGAA
jgi:hypothetical protein